MSDIFDDIIANATQELRPDRLKLSHNCCFTVTFLSL